MAKWLLLAVQFMLVVGGNLSWMARAVNMFVTTHRGAYTETRRSYGVNFVSSAQSYF